MSPIERELEAIARHSGIAQGHLVTQLAKRRMTRTQLMEALNHSQAVVSRLELLISRLGYRP